ncbi:MAG TPA: chemotaxis protein CheB [Thermoanaerobaculia bacterium]|nr:chemotaxis protein CheB [Thermoanaerobaculia bacterium]
MPNRSVICIGASAGGLAPLTEILSGIPETLPAALFVVLHMSPDNPSQLPEILDRAGPLKAAQAVDGEEIRHGRVYVAVPDHHLLIEENKVRLVRGPRENRHRPSIDNLFRSAARFHGSRVIGVVLSGSLDDGTAGLIAIKIRGGVAIVQEPAEAFSSEMPRSAMRYLDVDHVKPAAKIGPLLSRLIREPMRAAQPPVPVEMVQETKIAKLDLGAVENEDRPGRPSPFACPDCRGVLWEIEEGQLLRFRCRVGHAFSPETMVLAGDEAIEAALWEALRAIEERVSLRRRLAQQARERHLDSLADHFEKQIPESEQHVSALRDMLLRAEKT